MEFYKMILMIWLTDLDIGKRVHNLPTFLTSVLFRFDDHFVVLSRVPQDLDPIQQTSELLYFPRKRFSNFGAFMGLLYTQFILKNLVLIESLVHKFTNIKIISTIIAEV